MKEAVTLIHELKRTDEKATLYEHGDYRVCVIEKDDMFEAWLSLDEFVRQVEDLLEDYEAYYEIMNWQDRIRMEELLADLDDDAESETA